MKGFLMKLAHQRIEEIERERGKIERGRKKRIKKKRVRDYERQRSG